MPLPILGGWGEAAFETARTLEIISERHKHAARSHSDLLARHPAMLEEEAALTAGLVFASK